MPRLKSLTDDELVAEAREFIEMAEKAGSPDSRVLRILFKTGAGLAWYRYWRALSFDGILPKDLKELCRVKIAFDHTCGYCSTVRSVAAAEAGLTEEKIQEVWDYENSDAFDERERTALRFTHYMKNDMDKADSDEIYVQLKEHFTEEEIVELGLWLAENVGAGSFVRTLSIIPWEVACELNPLTAKNSGRATAA